ncbi:MAG: glycosyltransferase family 9 protein [Bacteroidetes bacterium]|nr:glycosyltransferase family 9 protein [Bacteroidota bacterium]
MIAFQLRKPEIHRILVVKPRAIGDVLLSTPVLPNLRNEFPNATIHFLVEKFAAPVLAGNPYVDEIISYDTKTQSSLSIISQVRRNKYDLIIDLFANPRTAVITALSGARYRVGFPFKWRRVAYNILVKPRSGEVHNVEFNLDALRKLGLKVKSRNPLFYLDSRSGNFSAEFVLKHHLKANEFITMNVGGGWQTKRWSIDNFGRLSQMIASRLGLPVVVLYGPSEAQEAASIAETTNAILAPPTSLHEMGAIMTSSLLLVTNDSGPMHIASALEVPTLAIFGPTSPRLQGPYGNISVIVRNEALGCLECNLTKCTIGNLCMTNLGAETVFESLLILVSKIHQISDATTAKVNAKTRKPDETV